MPTDPLRPLLRNFGAQARTFFAGTLCGSRSYGAAPGEAYLHLLRAGSVTLNDARGYSVALDEPTLIFYSRPLDHRFLADRTRGADLVCASVRFRHTSFNPVLLALPERFQCPLADMKDAEAVLGVLFEEAFDDRPGRQEVVDRLFEVVLVGMLRIVLQRDRGPAGVGLLRGLSHPQLGKALSAMHAEPARDWSIDGLADAAGMSRSSFAAAFKECVGDSPGNYLAGWRVALAQTLILEGRQTKAVAEQVGYASQAGFLRAFKSAVGRSPTEWKREQQLIQAEPD